MSFFSGASEPHSRITGKDMPTTKYYLGFTSSPALENSAIVLLDNYARNVKESQVPHMEKTMELFVPELLQAFLVGTVDAIGLSSTATKIVHTTADLIGKTANMLVPQLLRKRSNEELKPLTGFIDEIYVRGNTCSTGKASTGCEIDKATFDRMQRVIGEVRAGNGRQVLPELHDLMSLTVDIMMERLMKRAIDLIKLNFVVRKIADGAMATCKAAGHGVVNKVFKKLDDDQLIHVANYFDQLIFSAERD